MLGDYDFYCDGPGRDLVITAVRLSIYIRTFLPSHLDTFSYNSFSSLFHSPVYYLGHSAIKMSVPSPAIGVNQDDLVIPIIDFAPFLADTASADTSTPPPSNPSEAAVIIGNQLVTAFRTSGFAYLRNHGVSPTFVSSAFDYSARFFARPQEQKDALGWTTPSANRGYVAIGREKLTQSADVNAIAAMKQSAPDLKESFEIGRDGPDQLPNQWPEKLGDEEGKKFTAFFRSWFTTLQTLHAQLMRALALGLGLEPAFFDRFTDGGDNNCRLLHYPPVRRSVFQGGTRLRGGEHSDYGSLTLLFQDGRGGLQVRSPRDTFVDAVPVPDVIIINAGDLLARWANNSIKSTRHRIVEPPPAPTEGKGQDDELCPSRYSIAYFCNPDFDEFIEALPGTYARDEDKKYPGVNSGEYIVGRLSATY